MNARLANALRAIWNSVAFRLTLNYSALALLTSLVSLLFIYHQTVDILEAQFSRQVEMTAQRLKAHFAQGGLPGLAREIALELADHVNSDTEMFLLRDRDGKTLVGNIASGADSLPTDQVETKRSVLLRGKPVHGYLVTRHLPDGSTLIIGHDLRDLYSLTDLIKNVSLGATGVIALLVLLGATLFRRILQRRIEVIRHIATQIGSSDQLLTQRIPEHRRPDEFALLSSDINHMLDRIESLMGGVRNVSDAVAHHLRTPLTRMQVRLRNIKREGISRETIQDGLDSLSAEIEDLVQVSEKLLQIAEFESGTRRQKFESVALDQIAHDVVELYEAVAEEKQVSLICRATGPVSVNGDSDLLAGLVINLVDNALKYVDRGAYVDIQVTQTPHESALTVIDNGPGIPAEKMNRIGERFYRANQDLPGYGLGLATVLAIARLHGASMETSDAQPGLRVSIRFPRVLTRGPSVP